MTIAADHDVVKMRHHEIGVGDMHIETKRARNKPGQAADREQPMKPSAYSIGVV